MGEIISGDSLLMDCLLNLYWVILIICNIYVCMSNDLILDFKISVGFVIQ